MTPPRLVGIGVPTLDRLIAVPGPPTFGEGLSVRALGVEGGGPVATALVAARRFGCSAALVTRLGTDDTGQQIEAGLRQEGIDLHLVQRSITTRGATSVILIDPNGERAILYDPGEETSPEVNDQMLAAIRGADALLLDRYRPASLAGAQEAKAAGVTVQLDAGGFDERVMDIIPLCDIVIASAYYAQARDLSPEEAIDELIELGVRIAIVTLGAQGAIGKTANDETLRIPAFPVRAVDTTGAGDVYHGAFIVAHLEGQPLAAAMRFAAVAAALKCRQPGGRAGIPGRGEVDAILAHWTF